MNLKTKNAILTTLAELLTENKRQIIEANQVDVANCSKEDAVILDRLKVDESKVEKMISAVENVINLADPVGKILDTHIRENGLRIENRTVPFGTILIIYEARPDVAIEAAIIALKAGNKILLKGGKEAKNTNLFLCSLWEKALEKNGVDTNFVKYLDISREETRELIEGKREKFDVVIPRGGDILIDFVVKNSKAPVIVSGRGNNFAYIDSEADFEMAKNIVINGKSRLSVCNALDKVLINEDLPDIESKIAELIKLLQSHKIEVLGDELTCNYSSNIAPIEGNEIWFEEFLSAKIVLGIVKNTAEAIEKINEYSGGHSAAIITDNAETAEKFLNEVDSAAVLHNASTRFTDGGEFGLGAEIAISTQKLHFRGPLGVQHLLTNKWFVFGSGQIR